MKEVKVTTLDAVRGRAIGRIAPVYGPLFEQLEKLKDGQGLEVECDNVSKLHSAAYFRGYRIKAVRLKDGKFFISPNGKRKDGGKGNGKRKAKAKR
jgi:hypothetical protein